MEMFGTEEDSIHGAVVVHGGVVQAHLLPSGEVVGRQLTQTEKLGC